MSSFCLLGLTALFIQIVVTIAAFEALAWWQAIIVSLLCFVLLARIGGLIGRHLVKRVVRYLVVDAVERFGQVANASVLENAEVVVHSVRPSPLPLTWRHVLAAQNLTGQERTNLEQQARDWAWYAFDVSVYPHSRGPVQLDSHDAAWNPADLRLTPSEAPPLSGFCAENGTGETTQLYDMGIFQDGAVQPLSDERGRRLSGDGVVGPQRLQFVAGLPRTRNRWKFTYWGVAFGDIRVPSDLFGVQP